MMRDVWMRRERESGERERVGRERKRGERERERRERDEREREELTLLHTCIYIPLTMSDIPVHQSMQLHTVLWGLNVHTHMHLHSPNATDESAHNEHADVWREGGDESKHSVHGEREEQHGPATHHIREAAPAVAAKQHANKDDRAQHCVLSVCGTELVFTLENGQNKSHRQHLQKGDQNGKSHTHIMIMHASRRLRMLVHRYSTLSAQGC